MIPRTEKRFIRGIHFIPLLSSLLMAGLFLCGSAMAHSMETGLIRDHKLGYDGETGNFLSDSGQKMASVSSENKPLEAIIHRAANRYEVESALIKAIIKVESGYDPRAISHRGAKGLMQLMPRTARALGVKNIFDPEHNINGGVKYFKRLLNRFNGRVKLALAAYNAGITNVRKYNGVPPFRATRRYIQKVFKYYHHYKAQEERT